MSKLSNLPKRKFATAAASIATSRPVIPAGIYAGNIEGASITTPWGEKKSTIQIVPDTSWDDTATNPKTGLAGAYVPNGRMFLEGTIFFSLNLLSKKGLATLGRDEAKIFGGKIALTFLKQDGVNAEGEEVLAGSLDRANNLALINTCVSLGLDLDEIQAEALDAMSGDHEIPEEWANVPDIEQLFDFKEFQTLTYSILTQRMNGLKCLASVVQVPNSKDKEQTDNALAVGFNKSGFSTGKTCCVYKYNEGDEQDNG